MAKAIILLIYCGSQAEPSLIIQIQDGRHSNYGHFITNRRGDACDTTFLWFLEYVELIYDILKLIWELFKTQKNM